MLKRILTLTLILIGSLSINAQTISGTVSSYNGVAIANHSVSIMNTDSLNPYYSTTVTNASGAFSFSNLAANTYGYIISTLDCQNQTHNVIIASNSGTANFTICFSNPTTCAALFASYPDSSNNNQIFFTDLSAGSPTSWSWDFGDGTTSNLQNPNHTYAATGTYNVTLSISSASCSDSITQSVIVGSVTPPACQAAFYTVPDSSNQMAVNFIDVSTGSPTSWSWDFGDGTTSNLQNPNHTYAANGIYYVSLSISSTNCSDSTTQIVVIGNTAPSCLAAFSFYPDSSNQNSIHFTDLSTGNALINWSWDFGDGSTSNLQNPSHTYATNGTYTVTLAIISGNCGDTTSLAITIGNTTGNYAVNGSVMAGTYPVNDGVAILFDANSSLVAGISTLDSGQYLFLNVPNGTYTVLALPDSSVAIGQNYAPTYLGDVLFWSNASNVNISSNHTMNAINLVTIPSIPVGPGFIGGNVGTGTKARLSNKIVNLLDNSMNLIATTKTDANGDYKFENLAYATYKIWVEISGKVTTPISVTLNEANSSSTHNDFVETTDAVTPKTASIENNQLSKDNINLYPNPVHNTLNINLNVESTSAYNFNIFSISGQLLSSEKITTATGNNLIKLNTNNLSSGSYILIISNGKNKSIQKLFTK